MRVRSLWQMPIGVATFIAAQACASTGSGGAGDGSASPIRLTSVEPRGSSFRISTAEITQVPEGKSALDIVRRLRPEFLKASDRRYGEAVTPSVYENDKYLGGVEQLEMIPIAPLVEIRRLSAVEAKSVYGSYCKCDGGVIVVRTKPGK